MSSSISAFLSIAFLCHWMTTFEKQQRKKNTKTNTRIVSVLFITRPLASSFSLFMKLFLSLPYLFSVIYHLHLDLHVSPPPLSLPNYFWPSLLDRFFVLFYQHTSLSPLFTSSIPLAQLSISLVHQRGERIFINKSTRSMIIRSKNPQKNSKLPAFSFIYCSFRLNSIPCNAQQKQATNKHRNTTGVIATPWILVYYCFVGVHFA